MDDNDFLAVILVIGIPLIIGVVIGVYGSDYSYGYIQDTTVVKFHIAENLTSNMTVKEKIDIIKKECDNFNIKDICYSKMFQEFIKPDVMP